MKRSTDLDLISVPAPGDMDDAASFELPALRIDYRFGDASALLTENDVLAVIGFGESAAAEPGYIAVGLQALAAPAPLEVWRGGGAVRRGRDGDIRWSSDGDYTFAVLELDEGQCGGIAAASERAYALLARWLRAAPGRHLLRIWNYLDAINRGDGDEERYRLFCAGRAAGMDGAFSAGFPAATAIGRRDGRRVLQLYWLAARVPGVPLENPRQLSSWRYPREYGPRAPVFARAMRAPVRGSQIYVSGTAAIVGHRSHHRDDCMAQLEETLANLASLLGGAHVPDGCFGARSTLKAYVRHAEHAAAIEAQLRTRLGADLPLLLLQGDVCRAELLLEIDGVHHA